MFQRFVRFCTTYVLLLLIFMLQKPLFILFYHGMFPDAGASEVFATMWHGLVLDASVAGYLTAVPTIMLIVSLWYAGKGLRIAANIYFGIISAIMSLAFTANIALYGFWGFPLDSTPLFYFFSSPADAMASVSAWTVAGGILFALLYAAILYLLFRLLLIRPLEKVKSPWLTFIMLLLMTGLLIIPIRGGLTVSTANTGKVYFSDNLKLNHAAVNPLFSLLESLSRENDFGSQYRFMSDGEATAIFRRMTGLTEPGTRQTKDSTISILNRRRPDILFVILESFSSHLLGELGGDSGVAVNLDSLSREGVLFTRFYANSFRTDRGLVSILSGYPAQPTTSIMKYPRKSQTLPSIAGALVGAGYDAAYYYGGDADFTNMRSYLKSSGFGRIISDSDFPVSERLSKWGVHDHFVMQRFVADYQQEKPSKPRFRVIQTSSSHEPFEVPYRRLSNPRLNAFAYTDSCVGALVRELRHSPAWDNLMVVLVPDHLGAWPEDIDNLSEERYRIPLIIIGGAVKPALRFDVIGSQQDIAATLLSQLGISYGQFTFSKDLLNPGAVHFAFFTFPDAMGIATDSGMVIYDNSAGRVVSSRGDVTGILDMSKAYLQKLYDDIDRR